MKKQLLTLVAIAISTLSFAQSKIFILTPKGLVNATDTAKDFIVIDAPGKSQSDLYKSALVYFSSTYISPKDVISKVENEVLSINGYQEGVVHENRLADPFNLNYTVVLKFKDGKVKIESPSFRMNVGLRTKYLVYTGFSMDGHDSGLYGKNGKVKSERAIGDLEKFFNDFVSKYTASINNSKKDNW